LRAARSLASLVVMRLSPVEIGLLGLAAVVVATTIPRCSGHASRKAVLASWTLTPGVLNPAVDQATIRSSICVQGWTRTIRPPVAYTNGLKRKGLEQYGLRGPPSAYQEDHLISLELGGHPTDPRNLWPEPYPRASQVDRIENELNAAVCSGRLSLAEAQRRESSLKHGSG
jgi:hypothetical protein